MKKTLTLVALAGVITFSSLANETPVMTQVQNEAESTKIEQRVEHQNMQMNMNENKFGAESGSGLQTRTQTKTRSGMENMQMQNPMRTMQMQGTQMQPQMQNNSRMGGSRSR